MDLGLKDKVAVVTGGSRGIGRAIARRFAEEGARIAICARTAPDIDKAVDVLKADGADAWGMAVDVSEPAGISTFIANVVHRFGGIDVLVSNVSALSLVDDESAWRAMFEIDLIGTVRLFEAAQPYLRAAGARSGDAAFTLISSIVAGEPYKPSPYSAIKAALINYAKGVARTNAPYKTRCNVISPGNVYFEDGVWSHMKRENPAVFQAWLDKNPTGRMGSPEEIASAAVFLSSPRSAFTTGANLVIDGCLTQHAMF
ncbi:SDR family NAD(P)-dependent oxidoreductase [Novosphingobium colocasiae]|uniref:Oxidoreductase n=1 Tax=Novosphingobium colocasiae TaxID=1256513 RepID=A0A918UKR2_9SPHN|nr:SDR family oxidoreductase [Novosphingobium colocasiae]GGZ16963.1 oxidoreductase [Novosphingobium colocasiae]